jgi:hypothetical protein
VHLALIKALKNKDSNCKNKSQHPLHAIDTDNVAVNLTDKELDPVAVSILSKGLNFARATTSISNVRSSVKRKEQFNSFLWSQYKKYAKKPAAS